MNKFYTIVITVVLIACQHINSCVHATKNDDDEHERSKRFVFLQTSGIGVSNHEHFKLFFVQFECIQSDLITFLCVIIDLCVSVFGGVGYSNQCNKSATCLYGFQF